MKFTKMQGIGNDYVYVNCLQETIENPSELAKKISDRHYGVGSDGLIMINPSDKADFEMEMYNADGSRGEMCGNGIRCVAKYVYDYGLTDKTSISVETLAGIKYLDLTVEDGKVVLVKVDMGKPMLRPEEVPVVSEKEEVIDEPITVDGQEYALPKGLDSVAVALNTGLFEKYGVELPQDGWTWDDMRSVATELKDAIAAAGGSEYPIVMELDSQPSWMNFLYQNGGSYLSEDGKTCNVALPESKDAIQQVVDLMDNGQMAPYSVLTETKGTDLFISGQAAIVFIGSWKSSVLEGSSLAQEGNVQLIQMPAMAVNNKTCMGGLGYVMAANCQHKAEAWEFMKYITGKDAMTREAEAGIDIPAYLDAQAGYVANFKNINAQVFMDASANGFAYPSNGNFDWTSSVDEAVQAAFGEVKTVDEALDQGAADAQAILDEVFG